MKIVLDTNVFISGVFFSGPPYEILKAWRDGKFQLAISEKIYEEYQRVGKTLAAQFSTIDLGPILGLVAVKAKFTNAPDLPKPVSTDPEDDKFPACALAAEADLIVSGDKHLLKVSGYKGINVISPRKFVEDYLSKL